MSFSISGALDGGFPCPVSILRNGNVACPCRLVFHLSTLQTISDEIFMILCRNEHQGIATIVIICYDFTIAGQDT